MVGFYRVKSPFWLGQGTWISVSTEKHPLSVLTIGCVGSFLNQNLYLWSEERTGKGFREINLFHQVVFIMDTMPIFLPEGVKDRSLKISNQPNKEWNKIQMSYWYSLSFPSPRILSLPKLRYNDSATSTGANPYPNPGLFAWLFRPSAKGSPCVSHWSWQLEPMDNFWAQVYSSGKQLPRVTAAPCWWGVIPEQSTRFLHGISQCAQDNSTLPLNKTRVNEELLW